MLLNDVKRDPSLPMIVRDRQATSHGWLTITAPLPPGFLQVLIMKELKLFRMNTYTSVYSKGVRVQGKPTEKKRQAAGHFQWPQTVQLSTTTKHGQVYHIVTNLSS